jgi:hypothetical protein
MKVSTDLEAISLEAMDGDLSLKPHDSFGASNGPVMASFEEMKQQLA